MTQIAKQTGKELPRNGFKILNVHPNALIFVEGVEIYPEDHLWDEEQVDTSPWTGIPSNYLVIGGR